MVGMLGKQVRLNRLFSSASGRIVDIMFDHSIARGIQPGLDHIQDAIDSVAAARPDAMTMLKGIADSCFEEYAGKGISLVLKATSPSPYDKTYAAFLSDVEEAVQRGADAISVGCVLGGQSQARSLEQIAVITKAASAWGMPVIGHFYPRGEMIDADKQEYWENVAYAARAGAEIGVDILKIHHSGVVDELQKIIACVPAKIVLAGGGLGNDIRSYLQMAKNICDAGGAGVAFGRSIWGHENPAAMVAALKLIVHENGSVQEAAELLEQLSKKSI